ncbi:MAG: DUF3048 domain-containing protein [Clostridia bacterium]|nr:DUF3048 domain-containing protein [Clostridia bacterium]
MKKILALIMAVLMITALFAGCTAEPVEEVIEEIPEEIIEEEPVVPADPFYDKVTEGGRSIAVMIDNDADYKGPQAGLENAFMIYEVYVEGGNTRMMALFKDTFFGEDAPANGKIGPVRSSRHYFLDFALENDAIYAHCGWSPRAQSEISSRGVNNINGLYESAPFFRDSTYNNTWHNLYTDFARLDKAADSHGYRRDTSVTYNYLKNYTVPEEGNPATKVSIPYSQCNISYTFNEETGLYDRVRRGSAHTMQSGKSISVMNIIVLEMQNVNLNDGEGKGRQDLYDTGKGAGKYITGGKAIDITWEKTDRSAKAKYTVNGEEIELNPGLTFVQIVPSTLGVTVE